MYTFSGLIDPPSFASVEPLIVFGSFGCRADPEFRRAGVATRDGVVVLTLTGGGAFARIGDAVPSASFADHRSTAAVAAVAAPFDGGAYARLPPPPE